MNKTDFIKKIAQITGNSIQATSDVVGAFIDVITEELGAAGEVQITDFGKFVGKKKPASEGRNPSTGAKIKIPARIQAVFRPGKKLKEDINSKKKK